MLQTNITTQPQLPQLPQLPSNLPTDPTNPLAWIIVLTVLLSATAKPLNASANLIKAIATLVQTIRNSSRSSKRTKE
jgi:hypothetical protein